jgi:hypothetical protein
LRKESGSQLMRTGSLCSRSATAEWIRASRRGIYLAAGRVGALRCSGVLILWASAVEAS